MSIKLSVPMVFDMGYCEKLVELNEKRKAGSEIYEVYGSLKEDIIGNLRPSKTLKEVSIEELEKYIQYFHLNNIKFSYTMNATVSDGMEYDSEGRNEILKFIESLIKIGVDNFTITSPYLIRLIHTHFPEIGLTASICDEIDTVQKAMQFEQIGVNCIVLSRDINRDFKMLNAIKRNVKIDIKLLCTTPCIYRCMDVFYHSNLSSTMSNGLKKAIKVPDNEFSHTSINCLYKKVANLEENIKSPWIRPEDMKYYNRLGINYFKIDGRDKTAEYNIDVITAYMNESFDGNLLYLMNDGYPKTIEGVNDENDRGYIKIGIDNKKMSNYLKVFIEGKVDCRNGCNECKYCSGIAEKNITVNWDWRSKFENYLKGENNRRLEIR